jgi:UDPglucose--hexose-1-phosphate uridylyltransferase
MTPPEVLADRAGDAAANGPGWNVRVVPNKYPALTPDSAIPTISDDLYQARSAIGVHEVIIEAPDHITNMAALDEPQFERILRAYQQRLRFWHSDKRWHYALIYKNQGEGAGASLEHVHSQLIVLPRVPQVAIDELDGVDKHFVATSRCIYCDVMKTEVARQARLILNQDGFVAFCPFAARFPYEVWILPKAHAAAFELGAEEIIAAAGRALRAVILRLNRALDDPPFNFVIHSNPWTVSANPRYHWHIEIMPQLARAAGFEWGSGMHINPVSPEAAAKLLRDTLL